MIEKLSKSIDLMKQADFLQEQFCGASELLSRLQSRELIISVIGQFKRGKSSLINSLIGEEILPVGIIPLTTAVTEIRRGSEFKAYVCFSDGTELEIGRADLADYVSEQRNPDNRKNVEVVKLWTERSPFSSNVTLVDTPGVGSVHQHNTDTSYAYIEKSDAVLFLLSVDSPVSEAERDFLMKAREHAVKFYFAVNKIDTVSEKNLQEFLGYCKAVLSEAIAYDVKLFPTSAKTGEGVAVLAEKLSYELRDSHDELLEASAAIKLETILAQAKAKLTLYLKAAAMPAEELKIKMRQIRSKQEALDALSDEVLILTRTQTERLVKGIGDKLEGLLPEARSYIKAEAQLLYDEFKFLPSRQFESKFVGELEHILYEKIDELRDIGLIMLKEGYASIAQSLVKKALDIAHYISEMVSEHFAVEYPVSPKEYHVSERSDNFIKTTLYKKTNSFIHIIPKTKANEMIFDKLAKRAADDLSKNKTRMVYDYSYKMQESLRLLHAEFIKDISGMNDELNQLFAGIEQGHISQKEELIITEKRLSRLMKDLDKLS